MRSLMLVALLVPLPAAAADAPPVPAPKNEAFSAPKPPCLCRSKAGKSALGETICVRRGGRNVTLRCELVLNNTSWREVEEGCGPTS